MSEGGRPASKIDWKKVDELLMAGCSGSGIAHYIGINPATLYSRCLIEKQLQFSEYSQQKKEKGDEILRAHQYAKALGLTDKGDNTLLIWLGKNRLRQSDSPVEVELSQQSMAHFGSLMSQLAALQDKARKDLTIEDTTSNAEHKS